MSFPGHCRCGSDDLGTMTYADDRCRGPLGTGSAIPAISLADDSNNGCFDGNPMDSMGALSLCGGAKAYGPVTVWTINVGGLSGYWRLINLLSCTKLDQRPLVILVQEVMAGPEEWLTTVSKLASLHYKAYCCNHVGKKKSRGVVTLASVSLASYQLDVLSIAEGTAINCIIGGVMVTNVYAVLREHRRSVFCIALQEWMHTHCWFGAKIAAGDFNEEDNGWCVSIFEAAGYEHASLNDVATRWNGSRQTDHFYICHGNTESYTVRSLREHISDRKILEISACFDMTSQQDRVFVKQHSFTKYQALQASHAPLLGRCVCFGGRQLLQPGRS